MVHCFTIGGKKLVYDPVSGALHEVDDKAYELINSLAEGKDLAHCPESEFREVLAEIRELKASDQLFTPDPGRELFSPPGFTPKALCLMVAQACNLRCDYCFAGEGTYGGSGLMTEKTALGAVDFLFRESGSSRTVEVDFFGGEPLLNFSVIVAVVEYAKEKAAACGKNISFTVTTNALLLDQAKTDYLLETGVNVVLSIDGREKVHDRFRRFPDGMGSYDRVLDGVKAFYRRWSASPRSSYCYLRGTYTRMNPDFAADFCHLAGLGFKDISLEPVVTGADEPYSICGGADLTAVAAEYERLAECYLGFRRKKKQVRFFHFELDPAGGPCLTKRVTGCGAGFSYLAVSADGRLYPCHQFVGKEEFCIGDLRAGVQKPDIIEAFRRAHVYNKPCASCWARFYCGGGCHAAAHAANGTIFQPSPSACSLIRRRIECALYVLSETAGSTVD
ncbi:MAG: thioether cross-link-forming SCIFF peptide maturase [Bacillota bacterium]